MENYFEMFDTQTLIHILSEELYCLNIKLVAEAILVCTYIQCYCLNVVQEMKSHLSGICEKPTKDFEI